MPGINSPRWADLYSRMFDIRGGSQGPETVLPDIFPVVSLNEDDPTMFAARGELMWTERRVISAGGAATFGQLQIQPIDNTIACITAVYALNNAAAADVGWKVETGVAAITPGAPDGRFNLDSRVSRTNILSQATTPAGGLTNDARWYITGSPPAQLIVGCSAILVGNGQGATLTIRTTNANNNFYLQLQGWTRRLGDAERFAY